MTPTPEQRERAEDVYYRLIGDRSLGSRGEYQKHDLREIAHALAEAVAKERERWKAECQRVFGYRPSVPWEEPRDE